MYRLLSGEKLDTYAGKIIGPAWNLLPEDNDTLPELVPCEWLNTTCTLYRKAALPVPVFSNHFTGYSLMEDVTLSVTIGRNWDLLNARTARIFHDSQTGDHKSNVAEISQMELVNRYYVMSKILERRGFVFNLKFLLLQIFGIVTNLRSKQAWANLPGVLWGKISGTIKIVKTDW